MAGTKRERQRAARLARQRAAEIAQRKARARRLTAAALLGIAVVLGLVYLAGRGDEGADVAAGTTTVPGAPVTTGTGADGAAKACVPVAEPTPPGAPAVPVRVGPPPEKLVSEDLTVGTGEAVAPGATVTVNYIGVACSTGKIFDSSYGRNQPATFPLGGVIKGWQQGIPGMKVGGQRLLGIPPEQAYGPAGQPPTIGPDETLWFVVEVLATK